MTSKARPALIAGALCATLAVAATALFGPARPAQAQAATRLVPLGASGQLVWYADTDRKLVVMCNAFNDNSIECRTKPLP